MQANGLRFAYLSEGTGPLVLLLHGFPDTAHTWDHVMPAVAWAVGVSTRHLESAGAVAEVESPAIAREGHRARTEEGRRQECPDDNAALHDAELLSMSGAGAGPEASATRLGAPGLWM